MFVPTLLYAEYGIRLIIVLFVQGLICIGLLSTFGVLTALGHVLFAF